MAVVAVVVAVVAVVVVVVAVVMAVVAGSDLHKERRVAVLHAEEYERYTELTRALSEASLRHWVDDYDGNHTEDHDQGRGAHLAPIPYIRQHRSLRHEDVETNCRLGTCA